MTRPLRYQSQVLPVCTRQELDRSVVIDKGKSQDNGRRLLRAQRESVTISKVFLRTHPKELSKVVDNEVE